MKTNPDTLTQSLCFHTQPSSSRSLSQAAEREQRAAEICGWFVKGPLGESGVHPSWQEVGHAPLMSWLAWLFWNSHLDEAAPRIEVEVMVKEVEAWVGFGYTDYTDLAHAYDFGRLLTTFVTPFRCNLWFLYHILHSHRSCTFSSFQQ